ETRPTPLGPAHADRRRFLEERPGEVADPVGRAERRDDDSGPASLHDHGLEEDVERTGGEQPIDQRLVELVRHVVDRGLDLENRACGRPPSPPPIGSAEMWTASTPARSSAMMPPGTSTIASTAPTS